MYVSLPIKGGGPAPNKSDAPPAQPEPESEPKPEPRPEPKPEPKPEAEQDTKEEPKPEPKPESKPDTPPEPSSAQDDQLKWNSGKWDENQYGWRIYKDKMGRRSLVDSGMRVRKSQSARAKIRSQ